jgi:hypothetical protein
MPRILGLFPASLIAARGGMSANGFYQELRSQGLAARRAEVLQLYKIARSIVATSPDEIFRDFSRKPLANELTPWPTKAATGIRQNVTLVYRDKTTGAINRTYWSVVSEEGITREQATAAAIDAYTPGAEDYDQDLIGAVHTGAYRNVPIADNP